MPRAPSTANAPPPPTRRAPRPRHPAPRSESHLAARIIGEAWPILLTGLAHHHPATDLSPADLPALRADSLTLLFELLITLLAERRELASTAHAGDPSTQPLHQLAAEIAHIASDAPETSDARLAEHFPHTSTTLSARTHAILGPARRRGSSPDTAHPFIPDAFLARAIDRLARITTVPNAPIDPTDNRDLSPRLLGAVYEQSLDHAIIVSQAPPRITLDRANHARKSSGSYYTPSHIIRFIVRETIDPILARRLNALRAAADPASITLPRLLDFHILDPAMGSGHFLLEALDVIAARLLEFLHDHPRSPAALDLAQRLEARRTAPSSQQGGSSINISETDLLRGLIAQSCICGIDIDPLAVELATAALWLHAASPALSRADLHRNLRTGNILRAEPPARSPSRDHQPLPSPSIPPDTTPHHQPAPGFTWEREFPDVFPPGAPQQHGFDAMIGNPPFLGRLKSATAHAAQPTAHLQDHLPDNLGPYTDAAGLFLLASTRAARPGARIALIQPMSLLAARDARGVRSGALHHGRLAWLWVADGRAFHDAAVHVCTPCIELHAHPPAAPADNPPTRLFLGAADIRPAGSARLPESTDRGAPWMPLAARALGIPAVSTRTGLTLADLAATTADFRDQYYGLRGLVVEDARHDDRSFPPLITTGLIEVGRCRWGEAPARFDGRAWNRPRIDLARLRETTTLARWAEHRLVPKLLVATQTRTLEAAVDESGSWLPVVPLITVAPRDPALLWPIAASLCAPPIAAIALATYGGTGLTANVIKLSARQLASMPIPDPDHPAIREAADLLRAAASAPPDDRPALLAESARLACHAFGLTTGETRDLLTWWVARLTPAKPRRSSQPITS